MAKYRTRQEKVTLAMQILEHLDSRPMATKVLATKMNMPYHSFSAVVEKLSRTGFIKRKRLNTKFAVPGRAIGWYINSEGKPTEEAVMEEFTYIDTKNRYPIRKKESDDIVRDKLTARKCRQCNNALPQSRYFKCYECEPMLPLQDDDFLFHGADSGIMDDLDLDDDNPMFEQDIEKLAKETPNEEQDE